MSAWSVTPYLYIRQGCEKTQDEKNLVQEIAMDILKEFFDNAIEICNQEAVQPSASMEGFARVVETTHYTSVCCSTIQCVIQ